MLRYTLFGEADLLFISKIMGETLKTIVGEVEADVEISVIG